MEKYLDVQAKNLDFRDLFWSFAEMKEKYKVV